MTRDELRHSLEFYQDLGVTDLNVRQPKKAVTPDPPVVPTSVVPEIVVPVRVATGTTPRREPAMELPPLAPEGDTLEAIQRDIGPDCRLCRLCEQRNKIVFGSGNPQSKLVFVGEGPGADEDAQGLPFVGRAGQLLTQMIENTASKEGIPIQRPDVYICNVVKIGRAHV